MDNEMIFSTRVPIDNPLPDSVELVKLFMQNERYSPGMVFDGNVHQDPWPAQDGCQTHWTVWMRARQTDEK